MATTFWPPTLFGRGAFRARIPLGRDWMRIGIPSTSRVGSTGCRGEGPTPVVTRFPPRTQRRWGVRTRARSAVPASQAASTPSRLSWNPCWEWQRLLAGPLARYHGSPRMSGKGTTDWLWPVGRAGVRPSRGTPRPNDPPCHNASKGILSPRVRVGKAPPSVGIGSAGFRRPLEASGPGLWVGTHRTGSPESGHPRPRRSGQGRPNVGNPAFPR